MAPADPWLSVIMPVHDGERYLPQALGSIRAEGTDGYEVIAVDDGSSDASPRILSEWERILPLRRLSRRGGNWVAATNAGLREARGRYACFLHQARKPRERGAGAVRVNRCHAAGVAGIPRLQHA